MSDGDVTPGPWPGGRRDEDLDDVLRSDARARHRIEDDLESSFLVEAAAGTGKTTVLVKRLVQVLARGRTDIGRVVAVTFTRKAAGELKLRLRGALDRARERTDDEEERRNLTAAIARLEEAHIGTIHSFCAELLRERPVEAGIDPSFVEIDEEESARLYERAFQSWIEGRLQEMPTGLRRALSRLAVRPSFDGSTPLDRLRDAGRTLVDWRDYPEPWSRRDWDREAHVDELVGAVSKVAALARACADGRDPLRRALAPTVALENWIRRSEEASGERDHDALEARLVDLLRELKRASRRKGRGSWPVEGISRADVVARRDELIEALQEFRTRADADLAALLRDELARVVDTYEELKQGRGQVDFLDLLVRARDLLVDAPEVRDFLRRKFTHVFVDEFQDTDPLQVEILLLLTSAEGDADWRSARPEPGKLFLVGDPKQSIYRFRRADVVLYQEVKRRLEEAGVEVLKLTRSFRSVRPLQATVNAAFAAEMEHDEESGQPEYVALAPHREPRRGQPSAVVLPVPEPYGRWSITKWSVEEGQPDVVADWLRWLLEESRWRVGDPNDGTRDVPVEPRHVALLFRRFQSWGEDVTRPYTAALEARGIPHVLSGGRSFHQREEVETLRAALTAIEWPDDELAVFATLKGSLFAVPDAALLRFRHELGGSLHPFRPLPKELDEELEPIGDALRLLARLHRRRNRVPIARTLGELLEETRAHAGFALRPAGHQVLANVQRVIDMARTHELRGGLSFRGFVQRLADDAERGGSTEAPVMEEGAEGVRVMTVHGAKGLEFPVVVLADITANISHSEPSSHVDQGHGRGLHATRLLGCSPWELVEHADTERRRDLAEGVRLAYVAATRARDLLVVPGVGDAPWEGGWVSPLNRALYPPSERRRDARPAPGCPAFGDRSVLSRPQRAHGEAETSVQPGLHVSEAGEEVVWWDPAKLQLDVPRNFGLRQEELLAPADAEDSTVLDGLGRLRRWKRSREQLLEAGRRPDQEILVVSEAEAPPPDFDDRVELQRVERPERRPAGRRFGTLVHTILRDVELHAETETVRGLARLHGRLLGARDGEIEAAAECVSRALRHPLMQRAAGAERRHREVPFTLRLREGRIVEGVLDLAFLEAGEWTVVDFKTDADVDALLDRYRAQAAWYAVAARRLLDAPARAILLSV